MSGFSEIVFVLYNTQTRKYINIDDGPGPMSSGYPYDTQSIFSARIFKHRDNAERYLGSNPEYEIKEVKHSFEFIEP